MPLWTIDLTLPDVQEEGRRVSEYTAQVVERLQKASNLVRENLRKAAENESRWHNRRARPRYFAPGDAVRFITRGNLWEERQNGRIIIKLKARCCKN